LIAPHNILTALFPHDLGLDSPNVANHYQLQSVGLEDFASYITELGIPFIWAQRVAGLDFMGARAIEIMGSAQESSKVQLNLNLRIPHSIGFAFNTNIQDCKFQNYMIFSYIWNLLGF
jgi:hypothetical protein